jgi:hypothetical protein
MYDVMFSPGYVLNERIARHVFEALPECGPVLTIMDRGGNCWSSDPEAFDRLNLTEGVLDDLRVRVDDGVDPAVAQVGDASVTMTQLATESTNCGYLIVAFSRGGSESIPASLEVIETLVSLITLAAELIERSSLLNDTQVKCYSAYGSVETPVN